MSSTGFKQLRTNAGYYINVADARNTFYQNNGTDVAPFISANTFARSSITSTILTTAGSAIFRDHGKTLTSSGRVFRKVQWVNHGRGVAASGLVNPANGVSSGTVGTDTATVGYDTFYIELPAAGQAGGASAVLATGVVYVPGLPGL